MPKNDRKNSPNNARNADSRSQLKPDQPAERRVLSLISFPSESLRADNVDMQIWNALWEYRYGVATMLVGAGLSIVLGKLWGMLCIGIGIGIVAGEYLAHHTAKKSPVKESTGVIGQRSPSKLTIHSAVYGTGPDTDIDVTDKLQGMLQDGLVVPVANDLAPRDPDFGKVKDLTVVYSYGNPHRATVKRREGSRLVLPEDTWLRDELDKCKGASALQEMAEEDSGKLAQRLHEVGTRAEFHFSAGADPYIDIFIDLVNASVFQLVTFGETEGHARYGANPLATTSHVVDPPFTLEHGETRTMVIRQFLSENVADLMWAERSRKVLLDLSFVSVSFKGLCVGMPVKKFGWLGPAVTLDGAKRIP
jgi:hypothetical protein